MAVAARLSPGHRRWLMLRPEDAPESGPPAGSEALVLDLPATALSVREARARLVLISRTAPTPLYARIHSLETDEAEADLAAAAEAKLQGVVLTDAASGADVQHVAALLAVAEARAGLPDGALTLLPCVDSAAAFLRLPSLPGCSGRLEALLWDGESLARDVGAEAARDAEGSWTGCCQTARSLVLAAAAAAGIPAIDAPFRNAAAGALRGEAETARRDGFAGKIAVDAAQLAALAEVFRDAP